MAYDNYYYLGAWDRRDAPSLSHIQTFFVDMLIQLEYGIVQFRD